MSERGRAAPGSRRFDAVCMGRAAVDLYGEQIGGRLEDMRSFAKYLGGSPANTAVGMARLGLKPAMLTRVGDEHLGRFVRERLAAEGVDVGHVATDPERLTALVVLGIRDRDTFPLVFYRDRCADMAIDSGDVDPELLAATQSLLLSGTHLSQPGTRAACERAIVLARAAGARVVLDIDYRPVLWGLTSPGLGEQRYVESARVSRELQRIVPSCDLVVGTEEEIRIAGGSPETGIALGRLRAATRATIVMKQGPMGCSVFAPGVGAEVGEALVGPGFPVEVFNVLGAGDAFMAGFLRGWLLDEPLETCASYANACGALVVSRHGCAPAMPSWTELQRFIAEGSPQRALRFDADLEHLHRATTRLRKHPELAVLAFDHRLQFEELAQASPGAPGAAAVPARDRIARFKALVAEGGRRGAAGDAGFGVIVDDRYGEELLPTLTGSIGWIARPVERPGSRPLAFEGGDDIALTLRTWPTEHVAKCLVLFHPDDDAALQAEQTARLRSLQAACIATDREFLVEVIPPRAAAVASDTLARALEAIYAAGVRPDWWKLPPPGGDAAWQRIAATISRHDPHCRGVLLLGLEASEDELALGFAAAAAHPACRGFAVGRSIFAAAAAAWFAGSASDDDVVADVAERYRRLVELWQRSRPAARVATPGGAVAAPATRRTGT